MKSLFQLYRDYCVNVENANCSLDQEFQYRPVLSETAFLSWWESLSASRQTEWREKFESCYLDVSNCEQRRMQVVLTTSDAGQQRPAA